MLNYLMRNTFCLSVRFSRFSFFSSTKKSQPSLFFEEDIQEVFVRGSGSGGQSVAKTSNCVQLLHVPTGIRVRCHKTRSRDLNRKEARRLLQIELEDRAFGSNSKRAIKEAKRKKNRSRSYAKSKAKHQSKGGESPSLLSSRKHQLARGRRPSLLQKRFLLKQHDRFRKFIVSLSKRCFGVETNYWRTEHLR